MKRKIIVIAGPTAVGKTEYAIETANRFCGEVISADSMQIYQYMNIGSAKPTKEEQARAKHHLVDVIDPRRPFSVAEYQKMAKQAIQGVFLGNKIPIISGGTGLYVNSLIYDMDFSKPPQSHENREQLEKLALEKGSEFLHAVLAQKDPQAAERIHPNNTKKIIRGLERMNAGEERIKAFSESFLPVSDYDCILIGLCREREELYERINHRVDLLIEEGLIEEVQQLLDFGLEEAHISMKGIGYKEVIGYLAGEYPLPEAIDLIKKNTRHYAKRQMTWFRRYESMKWFNLSEFSSKETALSQLYDYIEGKL